MSIASSHGNGDKPLPSHLPLPAELGRAQPDAAHPVLSGIDAHPAGGGSWLGITAQGSFAVLTNFTEAAPPPLPQDATVSQYRSRGELPRDWLTSEGEVFAHQPAVSSVDEATTRVEKYLESSGKIRREYPGFNLLIGAIGRREQDGQLETVVGYVTNRGVAPDGFQRERPGRALEHGGRILRMSDLATPNAANGTATPVAGNLTSACGLSNSSLDDPWRKVRSGEEAFDDVFRASSSKTSADDQNTLIEELFGVLATSQHLTSRTDFQNSIAIHPVHIPVKPMPGATPEQGDKLAWYATRTSTVVLVPRSSSAPGEQEAKWVERDAHLLQAHEEKPVVVNPEERRATQHRHVWSIR